ncbi:MAG: D-alanyl-D-alanine carboxypeptidase [Desulfobulbaceae bacterium]|nr:D-alanyl-D-alanine carboxypeptidase [Desulfobulbaceae bacterium]
MRPLVISLLFLLLAAQAAGAASLDRLVADGGYLVEVDGRITASLHADQCFIPASTIKVLSALTILRTLGENYHFVTQFYYDRDTGILSVKGSGDPFLTSEVLSQAAMQLREKGVQRVTQLLLDDSAFALTPELPDGSENSRQAYDTGNGALAVNFNTVTFRKDARGRIFQEDPNTPLLPITMELAASAPVGSQRVNVYSGDVSTVSLGLRHTAELLINLLRQAGINTENSARRGRVATGAKLILSVESALDSKEMVRSFLKHSTNFVANQLVLAAAAQRFGVPASWSKEKMLLESIAYQYLKLTPSDLQIQEGSGLSRHTCVSPKAMLTILRAFEPWKELLPEKFGALTKTGTMTDVYCLIGYEDTPQGPARFAILLNQERNTRKEVLDALLTPQGAAPIAEATPVAKSKFSRKHKVFARSKVVGRAKAGNKHVTKKRGKRRRHA